MTSEKLSKRKGVSNAWRGVTAATHLLKLGLTTRIFNGKDTMFWRDKWLADLPLLNHALKTPSLLESYRTVNDYWMPRVRWRWNSLRGMLPSEMLRKISNVILRQDGEGKDDICWGLTSSGRFSIFLAYESLLNPPPAR